VRRGTGVWYGSRLVAVLRAWKRGSWVDQSGPLAIERDGRC
jgi:hypothetical protein